MKATTKDPKDLVVAQIERAFRDIPIPRTSRNGTGWFFLHSGVTGYIGKLIKYILSLDGVMFVDLANVPLQQVIYRTLFDAMRKSSDQARVDTLQIELSGNGDKMLYGIIENKIKTLPEVYGKAGRYIKDESARKNFVSLIIDEVFDPKKEITIIPSMNCFFLVQEARQKYVSLQDQARFLAIMFMKKKS